MRALSALAVWGPCVLALGTGELAAQGRRPAANSPAVAASGDIRQSVVSVVGLGANGNTLIRGSGVVVGDSGLVATYGRFFTRDMALVVVDASGNAVRAQRIVVNDSVLDILLFQAPATGASIAPISTRLVRARDRLRIVTAEPKQESTITEAVVSRVESFGGGNLAILADTVNAVALGAPLFDAMGELVGIGFSAEEGGKVTDYIVPASDVQRLMVRSAQPRVVARAEATSASSVDRGVSAEAAVPNARAATSSASRVPAAPPPAPQRIAGTARTASGAAASLSRASFNTAGLANAEVLTNLFAGDFEKIEFGRDDMMFSVIFQQYLDGCARHCTAQLPSDKVEMTRQECATEQVTRNGYGVELSRSCVEWRTVGRGLYADPRLYGALNQNDAQNIGNNLRSMFNMMASGNPLGKATQFASSAQSYQSDMEQLVQLNACGNAAMKRFEANLVRFAQGKQPIRLDGESSASAALPFRESDYLRLAEEMIADDAAKWAFNRFVSGSVTDVSVTSRDASGRPMRIAGRYRFQGLNGPASGTFELAFNDGTPECLFYSDAPATCRNVSRRLASEYLRGRYWQ